MSANYLQQLNAIYTRRRVWAGLLQAARDKHNKPIKTGRY